MNWCNHKASYAGLHAIVDAIDENNIVLECDGSKLSYDRQVIRDVLESRKQLWQEQNTRKTKANVRTQA